MAVETRDRRAARAAMFDGLATMAAALGSGRRAETIEILAQGERTVEQVADAIGQSVANTSHHLRTLARAGLVASRREGTYIYYRLASEKVVSVWLALRELAEEQLADLGRLRGEYLGDRDDIAAIRRDELLDRLHTGNVVLIDVRPESEYSAGHLPGAISVPPHRLEELLAGLPQDGDIVAYCRGPFCVYADEAIRQLARRGRRALRLEDGVPEWRRAGGPVETGPPATSHPPVGSVQRARMPGYGAGSPGGPSSQTESSVRKRRTSPSP